MRRRPLLVALLAVSCPRPRPASARVPPHRPPDPPGSARRDDRRFSPALLAAMDRTEALTRERLAAFPGLRVFRRQAPRDRLDAAEDHYRRALADGYGWRRIPDPPLGEPTVGLLAWTDGRHVLAVMGSAPARAEGGLILLSVLTNLPG